jgi:hypothetical protein
MGIVTNKQFLTLEEQQTLKSIQEETQKVVFELGEIELIQIQLETRKQKAKQAVEDLSTAEKNFSTSLFEKYGDSTINSETFEIIKVE